jgi:acetyl-CoA/propionyl-CoA carboxylase, biotin carboxylase, biotin carboxyl carrier protein
VRVDSGVTAGGEISPSYDPMISKLIVWDADREQATARMLRALREYEIDGLTTLLPFHRALLASEQWADAQTCRDLLKDPEWLQRTAGGAGGDRLPEEPAETLEQDYTVEVSGRRFDVKVIGPPPAAGAVNGTAARKPPRRERAGGGAGSRGGDALVSPMQGTVLRVAVEQGATVEEGSLIAVVEAMKMENEITAHKPGTVSELPIAAGGAVASGDTLAVITDPA